MNTKVCKECGTEKSFKEYYKDKSKPDNYCRPVCKECCKIKLRKPKNEILKNKIYEENGKLVKKCAKCLLIKNVDDFYKQGRTVSRQCKICFRKHRKEKDLLYRENNKDRIAKKQREYYKKNKEVVLQKGINRYYENLEYEHQRNKEYSCKNKSEINKRRNIFLKSKRKNNPSFKLRENISRRIRYELNKINFSKNGKSILNYLDYSMNDLKKYLESQFDEWMNWDNYGVYNVSEWNDDDSSTWRWNIDHIIPQSKLIYSSMEDEEFNKCWALVNLRPYSAKQNLLDGDRK